MGPNECKYCGCDKFNADSVTMTRFRCGSTYWPPVAQANQDEVWQIANGCAARCAVQLVELREQVQRAVEVLEGARRYDFVDGYLPCMSRRSDGEFIEHDEAEQALEILRGNSPESPDSSSVTADQLAVSDYYEAVRQQVPWMVTIEHIEGLVEGYRRCGVMVWQAAEQIKLILGGGR